MWTSYVLLIFISAWVFNLDVLFLIWAWPKSKSKFLLFESKLLFFRNCINCRGPHMGAVCPCNCFRCHQPPLAYGVHRCERLPLVFSIYDKNYVRLLNENSLDYINPQLKQLGDQIVRNFQPFKENDDTALVVSRSTRHELNRLLMPPTIGFFSGN